MDAFNISEQQKSPKQQLKDFKPGPEIFVNSIKLRQAASSRSPAQTESSYRSQTAPINSLVSPKAGQAKKFLIDLPQSPKDFQTSARVYPQTETNRSPNSKATPNGPLGQFTIESVWVRNSIWLSNRNQKIQSHAQKQKQDTFKECTFQPHFFTKDSAVSKSYTGIKSKTPKSTPQKYLSPKNQPTKGFHFPQ